MPDKILDSPLVHTQKISRLRGVDAALKIVVAALYAVGICQLSTPMAALACCVISAMVLLVSMPLPRLFWRRMLVVNVFFIFLCLTLPIQFEEDSYTVASFGFLHISKEAFAVALIMLLKGNAIGSLVLLFIGSSSLDDNIRALTRVHVPQKFVVLILLTYVNIQLLQREAAKLLLSAELRGFSRRVCLSMLKTYAWLFGMIFVRAWQRSERVNTVMLLRGFSGVYPLLHGSKGRQTPQGSGLESGFGAGHLGAWLRTWFAPLCLTVCVIAFLWWVEGRSDAVEAFL